MATNAPNHTGSLRPRPPRLRPIFQLAFCLVFGLGCGMLFDRWALMAYVPSDAVSSFRLIGSAWNLIERYYVDRQAVNGQNLTYGAISGMVDALGDTGHSVFLNPTMVKQLHNSEKGQLKGVGVQILIKNRQMVIEAPLDDSPAQRAGLRSGEIILSVNGHPISGMTLNEAIEQISGQVGTTVDLGILDPRTHRLRMVSIVRAEIKLHDITWSQVPGTDIADVRIAGFGDGMSEDLIKALRTIQQRQFKGLVLDMRDNPGGILDEAVEVASQFLSSGNVLLIKDATGKITPIPVKAGGLATNIPMAVLINSGSASAAEIVAGALGDAHRAELIGETTFGTGTVLNEFPLPGGSALLLAIEEWLTPDGQSYWHKGISPLVTVALPADSTKLEPVTLREMTPSEVLGFGDPQLLAGIKWVQDNPSGRVIDVRNLMPTPQ